MLRHENLVLELGHPVSEGGSGHAVELCTNWTAADVCPVKHVLRMEDFASSSSSSSFFHDQHNVEASACLYSLYEPVRT